MRFGSTPANSSNLVSNFLCILESSMAIPHVPGGKEKLSADVGASGAPSDEELEESARRRKRSTATDATAVGHVMVSTVPSVLNSMWQSPPKARAHLRMIQPPSPLETVEAAALAQRRSGCKRWPWAKTRPCSATPVASSKRSWSGPGSLKSSSMRVYAQPTAEVPLSSAADALVPSGLTRRSLVTISPTGSPYFDALETALRWMQCSSCGSSTRNGISAGHVSILNLELCTPAAPVAWPFKRATTSTISGTGS
mmetsp:Transcript_27740/g.95865  ORF Transcript_27740/g.95865 Transcript_27740/m.95865 type:complete len:254 (+) Transcript_27740:693-1454(+)